MSRSPVSCHSSRRPAHVDAAAQNGPPSPQLISGPRRQPATAAARGQAAAAAAPAAADNEGQVSLPTRSTHAGLHPPRRGLSYAPRGRGCKAPQRKATRQYISSGVTRRARENSGSGTPSEDQGDSGKGCHPHGVTASRLSAGLRLWLQGALGLQVQLVRAFAKHSPVKRQLRSPISGAEQDRQPADADDEYGARFCDRRFLNRRHVGVSSTPSSHRSNGQRSSGT